MGIATYLLFVTFVIVAVSRGTRWWVAEQRRQAGLDVGPRPSGRHGLEVGRLRAELSRLDEESRALHATPQARPARVRPETFGPAFSEADFLDFALRVFSSVQAARASRSWDRVGITLLPAAQEELAAGPALHGEARVRAAEAVLTDTHADELWRVTSVRFDALVDEPRSQGPLLVSVRETWRFRMRAEAPLESGAWELMSIPDGKRTTLFAPRPPLTGPAEVPAPAVDLEAQCAALGLDPALIREAARARLPEVLRREDAETVGPARAALFRDRMEDQILGVSRHVEDVEIRDVKLLRLRTDAAGTIADLWMSYQLRGWLENAAGETIAGDAVRPTPQVRGLSLRQARGEDWKVWELG